MNPVDGSEAELSLNAPSQDGQVSPDTPQDRIEGVVDGVVDGALRGWAWWPDRPERALHVRILADGVLLAEAPAVQHRADLVAADKRGGHCAFAIPLPASLATGTLLRVLAGEGDVELGGSPLHLAAAPHAGDAGSTEPDPLPAALVGHGVVGYFDPIRRGLLRGWACREDGAPEAVRLAFHLDGEPLLTLEANRWREDLAELRHGNGSCGFEAALPEVLADGRMRLLDIRLDGGPSLLPWPLRVRVERSATTPSARPRGHAVPRIERVAPPSLVLSVIVNFYNMKREAARTLTSLGRGYQQGIDRLDYEVLCIDNGSDPPLDDEWIRAFGPEFRLFRPSRVLPSPCAAINEAARAARGAFVAVMIDGAHVLTPGVLREAAAAIDADPEAVVAVRHWFIGGDQRWLAVTGYGRELEDKLFARIHWPRDGYDLFRIGVPISETAEPWFEGLNESNCLFLPTPLYDAIGGMEEAFSEPGAGFANLDLLRRAANAAPDHLVCLIGEASFHQFHGGTTTNIDDAAKDARVRAYANAYCELRGEAFEGVRRHRLKLRGRMRDAAVGTRQRPPLPMNLGVTPHVRPGILYQHFEEGAQAYAQSVYAECGLHRATHWLGRPVGMAPADLVNLQDILHRERPERILAVRCADGLIGFLNSLLSMLDLPDTRIVRVDEQPGAAPASSRVERICGDPCAPATLAAVDAALGAAERTLVLYVPGAQDVLPIEPLRAYARFVSMRSYLIVLGTVFGQPWLGYSSYWFQAAIRSFVAGAPFVIERGWNQHLITTSPGGYLRRVSAGDDAGYDASLDQLNAFEESLR